MLYLAACGCCNQHAVQTICEIRQMLLSLCLLAVLTHSPNPQVGFSDRVGTCDWEFSLYKWR